MEYLLYTYSKDKPYEYQGLKLTPKIFANIMVYLFDHARFTKKEVIKGVYKHHKENGGDYQNTDWTGLFDSVIEDMLSAYIIRISENEYLLSYASCNGMVDDMELDEELESEETVYCDMTIGDGKGAVYVYYYETYKQSYINSGYDVWPCKIGMSMGDPLQRIFRQTSTPSPECPHMEESGF